MTGYYRRRQISNGLWLTLCVAAVLFVLFWLGWILYILLLEGLRNFEFSVFTQMTPPPNTGGGLANALWGSFLLVSFAVLLATPIGIMTGIYLSEFSQTPIMSAIIRFTNDVFLSAPSIVIGLFVYQIMVRPVGHFSGWAGVVALALIAIPLIVRTTDDMLSIISHNLREAAAALGASQWVIIVKVVMRQAGRGIITGILLVIARISGETAPLLFTALNNQFWSSNLQKPIANVPNVIYQFAMSPYENWQQLAWNGAFIITLWVLACNLLIRLLTKNNKHR
ncbi:phosphate ABC transporter permease PstA [Legionella sp. CNM-4043-24]|uniref:phosphate ABC transporter permease PstA n=1 Tax=Legionella sp. CNM-4043-24 TaxID=3421646 RepID=UPI00403B1EDE